MSLPVDAELSGNLVQDSLQVTRIIEKYVKACGGNALADVKTEYRKGTLVRGLAGQVPFEIRSKAGGRWSNEQVFAWGDRVVYLSDGNTGWEQDTKQITDLKPEDFLYLRLLLDIHAPLRIREFYPEMVFAGSEMIGDKHTLILAVKSEEGLSTELSFDEETGFLLRAGEMYFEDYKDAGKIKRPYRILMGNGSDENNPRLVMQVREITHDQDIDDSYFSEPLCLLALKDSPIYIEWKETLADTTAMKECTGEFRYAPGYNIIITREQDHLFFKINEEGIKYEIRPASATDYFIKYINLSFHFVRDSTGLVSHLELGPDRTRRAVRIAHAGE